MANRSVIYLAGAHSPNDRGWDHHLRYVDVGGAASVIHEKMMKEPASAPERMATRLLHRRPPPRPVKNSNII
jgi:hypothetical protein